MTDAKQPRADAKWCSSAKILWASVLGGYVLEVHHREILKAACVELTRGDTAKKIIDADGPVIQDRFGVAKEHPAVAIERNAHTTFLRLLRELGLDVAPAESRGPRRPGTRG